MKDNFSKQADLYAIYRPVYPGALYDFITNHAAARDAAWDCGTGNGQAAGELAKRFAKVYATDISQKQIDKAVKSPGISYSVQPAERTEFPDNSFDLVTVAQALHWFRFDEFYEEVKRVTKTGAVLAAWCYSLLRISPAIDELIRTYHYTMLDSYWDKERKYVDDEYRNIPFPFEKIPAPVFTIDYYWTIEELRGYLNTWSALQHFIAKNNFNPVDEVLLSICAYWQEEKMKISFPVHLLLGKVH